MYVHMQAEAGEKPYSDLQVVKQLRGLYMVRHQNVNSECLLASLQMSLPTHLPAECYQVLPDAPFLGLRQSSKAGQHT